MNGEKENVKDPLRFGSGTQAPADDQQLGGIEYEYWNNISTKIPNPEVLDRSTIEDILEEWEQAIWTASVLEKKDKVKRIKHLEGFRFKMPNWVMDRWKECLNAYVRNELFSSFLICGAIAEFLTIDLMIKSSPHQTLMHDDIMKSHNKQFNRINQLSQDNIIDEVIEGYFNNIRKERNNIIHLNQLKVGYDNETIEKNLEVINCLHQILEVHYSVST